MKTLYYGDDFKIPYEDVKDKQVTSSFAAMTTVTAPFEASFSNTAAATAEHVAATADASAKVREGMIIVRILDGIVKNKYANDPGKLAAWISASPVEKVPKKKTPTREQRL